jgi:hypothetical protein
MPAGLVLEFRDIDKSHYEAVNKKLGIDMVTGTGNWPKGLLSHAAGSTDDGTFVVMEVWTSQDDQGLYMDTALGPALGQAGVPLPSRATWVDVVAYHTPGS